MRCCGRWKKAEAPLVPANVAPNIVQRQNPQSPARGQQGGLPTPNTPEQSNVWEMDVSVNRTNTDLLGTPPFTPVVRPGQQQNNL